MAPALSVRARMNGDKELLKAEELAEILGLELSTFRTLVAKGKIPHAIDVSGKGMQRWRRREIAGILYILEVTATGRIRLSTPEEAERDAARDP